MLLNTFSHVTQATTHENIDEKDKIEAFNQGYKTCNIRDHLSVAHGAICVVILSKNRFSFLSSHRALCDSGGSPWSHSELLTAESPTQFPWFRLATLFFKLSILLPPVA